MTKAKLQHVVLIQYKDNLTPENFKAIAEGAQTLKKIEGVHVLGIRSKTQVTKKVVESATKLMSIGFFEKLIGVPKANSCSMFGEISSSSKTSCWAIF